MPENEIRFHQGFNTKIQGFTGLPLLKTVQSPLTLQESTIEGFYTLLSIVILDLLCYKNNSLIVITHQKFLDLL